MNIFKKMSYILLVMWLAGSQSPVMAHDPGMSHASVYLQPQEILIKMAFMREDMEALVPIDVNHDGSVDAEDFSKASEQLQARLGDAIVVSEGQQPIAPTGVWVELEQDDSVTFGLVYSSDDPDNINLELPLMKMLARGHRQFLNVYHPDGLLADQYVVSATTQPIVLRRL